MTKLWGGRFSGATDALMKQFNDSISFDIRLWEADIRGSVAYANALAKAGVINKKEAAMLVKGLRAVRDEFAGGTFEVKPDDEDIHTAVERRLKEIVGDVAGKLHTGRSRNDQVALDIRLFTLDGIRAVQTVIGNLQAALRRSGRGARRHSDARLYPFAACPADNIWAMVFELLLAIRARPRPVG